MRKQVEESSAAESARRATGAAAERDRRGRDKAVHPRTIARDAAAPLTAAPLPPGTAGVAAEATRARPVLAWVHGPSRRVLHGKRGLGPLDNGFGRVRWPRRLRYPLASHTRPLTALSHSFAGKPPCGDRPSSRTAP